MEITSNAPVSVTVELSQAELATLLDELLRVVSPALDGSACKRAPLLWALVYGIRRCGVARDEL